MEKRIVSYKIELKINAVDDERKAAWEKLFAWRFITQRGANMVATSKYLQEKSRDLIYFTEDVKMKLADISKDPDGMLLTSNQNSGYQVLSGNYKGEIPTSILSRINNLVHKSYVKESKDYYVGKRSLRTYRDTIPIPFTKNDIYNLRWNDEIENFTFDLFQTTNLRIPFRTYLGKDLQNAKSIFDRIISGEFQMSDPQIQIINNRDYGKIIFKNNKPMLDEKGEPVVNLKKYIIKMLLPVVMPLKDYTPIENKTMECHLDVDHPVRFAIGRKKDVIGSAEEYLYRRLQIQEGLRRLQKAMRYAKGGHGRKRKMQSIDRYHLKEKNYIETRLHTYSKRIVEIAVNNQCERIVLVDQVNKEKKAIKNDYVLRNWSYHSFIEKITYKAAGYGIKVDKVEVVVK